MTATERAQNQDLSVKVTHDQGGSVISLDGKFNIDSSPGVRKQLLDILKRQSLPTLTIDLSDLTYIDCSGIATLIEALKIAKRRGTKSRFLRRWQTSVPAKRSGPTPPPKAPRLTSKKSELYLRLWQK